MKKTKKKNKKKRVLGVKTQRRFDLIWFDTHKHTHTHIERIGSLIYTRGNSNATFVKNQLLKFDNK